MNNDFEQSFEPKKYCYIKRDMIFAWATVILFLLFYDLVLASSLGLATAVFMLALYGVTAIYLVKNEIALGKSWYFLALGCLISLSFFINGAKLIKTQVLLFDIALYPIWILYACGNNANGFDMMWYDSLKALFVMPLSSLCRLFGAIGSGENGQKKSKRILLVFAGVIVAAIPTLVVTALLANADSGFSSLIDKISDSFVEIMGDVLVRIIVCLCAACPVFGTMYSNVRHFYPQSFSKETNEAKRIRRAVIPEAFVYAASTPMLIVYLTFFALQFRYFTSAFASVLPDGIDNYADFARRGFFELCVVALINTAVIILISAFTKRADGKKALGAKVYCMIYAIASLAFTAMVIAKMFLYIKKFGLTRLRVYTSLFMIMLGVLFVLVIIRQIHESFNFMAFACATVAVFALVVAFGRIDGVVASYNVDAYLDGKYDTIDSDMIIGLSDDCYPAIKKLYENAEDPEVRGRAYSIMKNIENRVKTHRGIDVTLADIIVRKGK